MPKTDYFFIDESGDIGTGEGDSSKYYAELVLHITDESIPDILKHVVNWRYIRGFSREMKVLRHMKDIEIFLAPLADMRKQNVINCSAVYLSKKDYTGPYLKTTSPRGHSPILFRNFVHRQLLEFHFSNHAAATSNLELIFDRFDMSSEAVSNLNTYLNGNLRLPYFRYITHADSKYTDFLQIASQLVNCIKDIISRTTKEENTISNFVSLKDITNIHK